MINTSTSNTEVFIRFESKVPPLVQGHAIPHGSLPWPNEWAYLGSEILFQGSQDRTWRVLANDLQPLDCAGMQKHPSLISPYMR